MANTSRSDERRLSERATEQVVQLALSTVPVSARELAQITGLDFDEVRLSLPRLAELGRAAHTKDRPRRWVRTDHTPDQRAFAQGRVDELAGQIRLIVENEWLRGLLQDARDEASRLRRDHADSSLAYEARILDLETELDQLRLENDAFSLDARKVEVNFRRTASRGRSLAATLSHIAVAVTLVMGGMGLAQTLPSDHRNTGETFIQHVNDLAKACEALGPMLNSQPSTDDGPDNPEPQGLSNPTP